VSLACLSCHDGVTGFDALVNKPGSGAGTTPTFTFNPMPAGVTKLGTDLTNDHPISFTYNAALATADGGLVTPASDSLVVTGIPLYSEKMECASCHNVHNNTTAQPFLRVANAGSGLCLKCHVK
jgi:predicted CXXCH cytochrome family protein